MVLVCARSLRSSSVAYFLGYLKILFTVNPFLKILSAPLPKVLSQLSSHSSPSWCADRVVSLPFQSSLHYCCNPDSTACSSWCSPHLKANTSSFHQLSLPWRSQFPCTGSAGTQIAQATLPLWAKWWMHKATVAVSQSSHPLCTHLCNFSFHTAHNLTPRLKQGKLFQVPWCETLGLCLLGLCLLSPWRRQARGQGTGTFNMWSKYQRYLSHSWL